MATDIMRTTPHTATALPNGLPLKSGSSIPRKGFYPQKIISGFRKDLIEIMIRVGILKTVFKNYHSLKKTFLIMKTFRSIRRKVLGDHKITKVARVNGKYYWDLYAPGFGSRSFQYFFEGEAARIIPVNKKTNRFTNVFIAFTKKCPLRCEHCFEWDVLNARESLTVADIKNIVAKFQEKGTSQIHLTGGEPLMRVNDIIGILNSSQPHTEFWILSSGYNLTPENAMKLKQAGLTGMIISLDHFAAEKHNQFRGFAKAFEWALEAVKNSISAQLVTAVSLCVTKSFVTQSNLITYADFAKSLGVSFIQILEPKAVGHYKDKDVLLTREHEEILKKFYLQMNYEKKYSHYPIITYHGYHQRKIGCFGSGDRNLYVDTDGDIHACPFCQQKTGNVLSDDLSASIEKLQAAGCRDFQSASTTVRL